LGQNVPKTRTMLRRMLMMAAAFLVSATLPTSGAMADDGFSIEEELFFSEDEMVTSVSKKEQKLSEAAAAIDVITQDDIRRSGATSIPEALRVVPGLQVARLDANKWAVSARGFNGRFANKLLVLIDGRSVYTPLFSGVWWDAQNVLLEDIARIEVIRGPGATLWGANAVNGVINIITKDAKDTQGGLVTIGHGTEERGFGEFRYGGTLGDNAHYRVYARYFDRERSVAASGDYGADEWDVAQGGLRVDWEVSDSDSLTLQGDIHSGTVGERQTMASLSPPYEQTFDNDDDVAGGNILGRWNHTFSDTSGMSFQLYYDRSDRDHMIIGEVRDTFDLDFQHRFALDDRHEIVWGLGYRLSRDDIDNSFTLSFDPDSRNDQLLSAFVQDEITLIEDQLKLTPGAKLEHNDYTGFEFQPSARLLWMPHEKHTVWAAVSRAVRTPSRVESYGRVNRYVLPPATLMSMFGDRDFDSEELLAHELGYRVQPMDRLSLDIATFYNIYENLRTVELGTPFPETSPAPPHLVVPLFADNKMDGETYGIEVAADWRPLDWWRLEAGYTYLQVVLHLDDDSTDTLSEGAEGESPHNQFSLRSSMDLPRNLELDSCLRYVDNLPGLGVDSYLTLDVRLGWKPTENLELFVVGQNLLDSHHAEFESTFFGVHATEVEHSVYAGLTWRF